MLNLILIFIPNVFQSLFYFHILCYIVKIFLLILLFLDLKYRTKFSFNICIGLIFCLIGDALLTFDIQKRKIEFYFGMTSFKIGHLFYMYSFSLPKQKKINKFFYFLFFSLLLIIYYFVIKSFYFYLSIFLDMSKLLFYKFYVGVILVLLSLLCLNLILCMAVSILILPNLACFLLLFLILFLESHFLFKKCTILIRLLWQRTI